MARLFGRLDGGVVPLADLSRIGSGDASLRNDRLHAGDGQLGRFFDEQILAFSDSSLDAPGGWSNAVTAALAPGGAIGNTFTVRGLTLPAGAATVGTIQVVTDETATDAALGTRLGLPRDLDGDGVVLSNNVSATARLLPVILQVNWTGESGTRVISQGFYLLGY